MQPADPSLSQASISRRGFLRTGLRTAGGLVALGATPAILAACGSSSSGVVKKASSSTTSKAHLADMNLQLSWVPDVEFAGAYLAKQKGYYGQHGLQVQFLPGGPSVSVEPVVVAGHALVGDSQVAQAALAVSQGAPLKIIGAKYQNNPFCLVSSAADPIDKPAAMQGKKIGVSSINLPPFKTLLALNHIEISTITVVPVQSDPTPLADGEVDGWVGFVTEEPIELELKGFKTYSFLFADYGYKLFGDIYEATDESLATRRDDLVAFLASEREGWKADLADPAAGVDAAKPFFSPNGYTAQQQAMENAAQLKLVDTGYATTAGLLAMSEEDIAANIVTLAAGGTHLHAKDLFDTSVLAML